MPNAWVEFVRQYAKENNLSYGCAISEAGPAYRSTKKGGNPKREKEEREEMMGEDFDTPKTPTKKRITIKPKIKKSNPKSQPKMNKSNPYDIIISNWDDDYLNVLIDQELPKLGENIERIAERKTLNDDLLLSLFPKEIIEGVLNIGGVEYLSKGLDIIIDNYNGKSFYPDWTLKKGSFPEKLRIRILKELEGVKKKTNRVLF